jgi:hypothetical protein
MALQRWIRRPEGSNWGDFGGDDQIGRLNLITPARRLAAAREVQDGIGFPLSLPLDLPAAGIQPGYRQPPRLETSIGSYNVELAKVFKVEGAIDVGNDDCVTLHLQYSTQWDSLAHVGALFDADGDGVPEKVFYNGYRGDVEIRDEDSAGSGVRALGIENMATTCVQGRGVMVNLFKAFGNKKALVGYETLMSVLAAQGIAVEPGDILCLYTGYGDAVVGMGSNPDVEWLESSFADLDGGDPRLLQWITDSGVAAICADNGAVEVKPEGHASGHAHCKAGSPFLPLHHHCIFKLGIHLGELWYFKDLAEWLDKAGRYRFLLTAPPLRLPGAVGSPLMPVGTV